MRWRTFKLALYSDIYYIKKQCLFQAWLDYKNSIGRKSDGQGSGTKHRLADWRHF